MEITLGDLKIRYNESVAKFKTAELWLVNPKVDDKKKDAWLETGKYKDLIVELSHLLSEYKRITGEEMADENVINGF